MVVASIATINSLSAIGKTPHSIEAIRDNENPLRSFICTFENIFEKFNMNKSEIILKKPKKLVIVARS
jgi:hypothetical protein